MTIGEHGRRTAGLAELNCAELHHYPPYDDKERGHQLPQAAVPERLFPYGSLDVTDDLDLPVHGQRRFGQLALGGVPELLPAAGRDLATGTICAGAD